MCPVVFLPRGRRAFLAAQARVMRSAPVRDVRVCPRARAPPARRRRRRRTPARKRAGPSRPAHNGSAVPRSAAGRDAFGAVCPKEVTIGTAMTRPGWAWLVLAARGAKRRASVVRYFVMKASFAPAAAAASIALALAAAAHTQSDRTSDTKTAIKEDAKD